VRRPRDLCASKLCTFQNRCSTRVDAAVSRGDVCFWCLVFAHASAVATKSVTYLSYRLYQLYLLSFLDVVVGDDGDDRVCLVKSIAEPAYALISTCIQLHMRGMDTHGTGISGPAVRPALRINKSSESRWVQRTSWPHLPGTHLQVFQSLKSLSHPMEPGPCLPILLLP